MGYQPLEDLLPKANFSIYKLIRMASQRAMELADGQAKLVDMDSSAKTATISLEEILAGRVVLKEAVKGAPASKQSKSSAQKEAPEQEESLA